MPPPAVARSAGTAATRRMLARPVRPRAVPSRRTTTTTINVSTHQCRNLSTATARSIPPSNRPTRQHNYVLPLTTIRTYHSHDHPAPQGPFTPAEATLLSAAYKHIPTHGFTAESLALGARDTGLLDISPSILPDGVFGLIRWHLHFQRTLLAEKAQDIFAAEAEGRGAAMTVGDRVEALAWARLRGNAAVVGRWQEALAVMAQPSYIPASVKELAQLADEILYLASDVSVDPSWYTKRASLSAIYAAAELFQTTDQSPNFRETRAFLRRRLDEAAQVGGVVRSVGEWVGFNVGAAVNVLRSKGLRI